MASRQQPFPMGVHERAGTDEQRASPTLDERFESCLDVAVAADIENYELSPDRFRCCLHGLSLCLSLNCVRVDEYADCCRLGYKLVQQFQSLRP